MSCRKCFCGQGHQRARLEETEKAASIIPALASVSVSGYDTEAPPEVNTKSPSRGDLNVDVKSIIRIWGARPYQPEDDNDVDARAHWRSVAKFARVANDDPADLASQVLSQLQFLNPGHGPGLPPSLPVQFDSLANELIVKIVTGADFILYLTARGWVYSMGIGNRGQLGHGDKVALLRTPTRVPFQRQLNAFESMETRYLTPPVPADAAGSDKASSASFSAPGGESANSSPSHVARVHVGPNLKKPPDEPVVFIVDIAAGDHHAIAQAEDGSVFVWGDRRCLGLRTLHDVYTPTHMEELLLLPHEDSFNTLKLNELNARQPDPRARIIGAGPKCCCVITEGDRLLMWGDLPGGMVTRQPELIGVFLPGHERVCKMEFGSHFGLFLGDKGNLYQVGIGHSSEVLDRSKRRTRDSKTYFYECVSSERRHLVPEFISDLQDVYHEPLPTITQIAVGDQHVMLLGNDGTVWTYGDNLWGQCGVGPHRQTVRVPTFVPIGATPGFAGHRIVGIAAGGRQSGAISESKNLYLWGCAADYRLISDAVKELVDMPIVTLTTGAEHCYAAAPQTRLGVSTEMTMASSRFQPAQIIMLNPFKVTGLAFGPSYTVVVTGAAPLVPVKDLLSMSPAEPVVAASTSQEEVRLESSSFTSSNAVPSPRTESSDEIPPSFKSLT